MAAVSKWQRVGLFHDRRVRDGCCGNGLSWHPATNIAFLQRLNLIKKNELITDSLYHDWRPGFLRHDVVRDFRRLPGLKVKGKDWTFTTYIMI